MLQVANPPVAPSVDGFGVRTTGIDSEHGDQIELLEFSPELVEDVAFVSALAERVARFAAVRHASYVHLRRLDRPSPDRLNLVSDYTPGWRLSELLTASQAAGLRPDITILIGLMRQLMPAVALYSRHNRDAAIGSIGIERLIVTPQARLVIAEHAFGPALEKLNGDADRLWRDYRVVSATPDGAVRSNQRGDAMALGVVALALLMGRPLEADEYPDDLRRLLSSASEWRDGSSVPVSSFLGSWLARTLQLEPGNAYQKPSEVQLGFESVLASDRAYVTTSKALEEWLTTVGGMIDAERRPAPEPEAESESAIVAVDAVATPEPEAAPAVPSPEVEEVVAVAAPARKMPLVAMAATIIALLAVVGWLWTRDTGVPKAGEGELVVESRPASAKVIVDGKDRGITPLTLRLSSGAHVLEVRIGTAEPRVIPLMIKTGIQTAQYIELPDAGAPPTPPKAPVEKTRKR